MNDLSSTHKTWDEHYKKEKSVQLYPDENLVRLLRPLTKGPALDYGCGSGRHLQLLQDLGYSPVYGMDWSENSIEMCRNLYPETQLSVIDSSALSPESFRIPLEDHSLSVVILWGVLHYNPHDLALKMVRECARVIKSGGYFLGTLRSSKDTHFSSNPDMNGASMHLYDQASAADLLSPSFSHFELGHITRTPVGSLDRLVAHWVFRASNG